MERYKAFTMRELKTAAVLNKDVETLKAIVWFEQHPRPIYFIKEDETIIRDRDGNEIDPLSLTSDPGELSFNLITIRVAAIVHKTPVRDFDLHNSVMHKPNGFFDFYIREVPADTTFPLPLDFNWYQHCYDTFMERKGNYIESDQDRVCKIYRGW